MVGLLIFLRVIIYRMMVGNQCEVCSFLLQHGPDEPNVFTVCYRFSRPGVEEREHPPRSGGRTFIGSVRPPLVYEVDASVKTQSYAQLTVIDWRTASAFVPHAGLSPNTAGAQRSRNQTNRYEIINYCLVKKSTSCLEKQA